VKPCPKLDAKRTQQVKATIERLGLNDEYPCVLGRAEYLESYCLAEMNFEFLRKRAPFVAMELQRQGLDKTIQNIMNYPPRCS